MKIRKLALLVFVGACASDPPRSGVPEDTQIADLTADDVQTFCDWSIAKEGGFGRSHHCDDGTTLTTPSVGSCVDTLADLTCTDTIRDFEDCIFAIHGDLCQLPTVPACAAYEACFP